MEVYVVFYLLRFKSIYNGFTANRVSTIRNLTVNIARACLYIIYGAKNTIEGTPIFDFEGPRFLILLAVTPAILVFMSSWIGAL